MYYVCVCFVHRAAAAIFDVLSTPLAPVSMSFTVCPFWVLSPIKSRLLVKEKGKEEMNRNMPERMLLLQKLKKGSHKESERPKKKKKKKKNNKFLITVAFLGSAGPIRFMVNNDDPVSRVINAALKSYAREGRLPILGSNNTHFFLYCKTDFEGIYNSIVTHEIYRIVSLDEVFLLRNSH